MDKSHYCDRCGKRAYVSVLLSSNDKELLFCGHHWDTVKHLLTEGNIVNDDALKALRNPVAVSA